MANTTVNSTAFIEAQQYSSFILENLHDGQLPTNFYRNVSDFGTGTTLNIKTLGDVSIQDVEENTPLAYNPLESGNVTLSITDYKGHAWYVTDILRQDGAQVEALLAQHAQSATRAIQEDFESRFLTVCNESQTAANPNAVNGFAHRVRACDRLTRRCHCVIASLTHVSIQATNPGSLAHLVSRRTGGTTGK